jgi:hypothetical protein
MRRLATILCNALWLLSALPGWLRFQLALWFPKSTQQRILRRILRENAGAEALAQHGFDRREPCDYEAVWPAIQRIMQGERNVLTAESPILLEPTGGSTDGTKLIPYTRALKKEFQRAIDPWIAGLFLKWPSLLLGRHYWSITPSTPIEQKSAIPIGFDSDAAYLGRFHQFVARHTLAVPRQTDPFNTLVHLLGTPDLRLISVWHPSLLTLMFQTLEDRFEELIECVEPRRARQLREIGCVPSLIWKKLKVISCWSGTSCESWINQLKTAFPHAVIQAKGLVATEGITSIPLGSQINVAAVRSHYYEFECPDSGRLLPLWQIEPGKTYHLILTTGGGLYRYATNDLVETTGIMRRTPCIRFLTRSNLTSDLFGEKISLAQAESICHALPIAYAFAMIAPEQHGGTYRYALYIEAESIPAGLPLHLESRLCENYHYRHARNIGQLGPAVVHGIKNGSVKMRRHLVERGRREGGIKPTALRRETEWDGILK